MTSLPLLALVPWKPVLQRALGMYSLFFLAAVLLGPFLAPVQFSFYYVALHCLFLVNNTRTAWAVVKTYYNCISPLKNSSLATTHQASLEDEENMVLKSSTKIPAHATNNGTKNTNTTLEAMQETLYHMIILPNYKESMETLTETLDVLASHQNALVSYKIILAMEASEKEALVKAKSLQRMYSDHFLDVLFTIHPSGRPGEIRGKSSNVAWAASEMVRRTQQGSCSRDLSSILLTVMDADTCFAQDYFALLESHYRAASLEERKKMMFAPCTVFDRNANQVSPIVRIADMLWSAGVMSNLYDSSPIKFPCSAYSLPLSLVHAVGYWDTDAHAIGEDMHMFLKCFFATSGQLEVKTIYSPASQCNVEGTWWGDGIAARYGQAKRHMWGCLDSGYVLRRSLFGLLAPGYDSVEGGEIVKVDRVPLERPPHQLFELPLDKLLTLVHRSLEAHVFMGHVFLLIILTTLIVPTSSNGTTAFWALFTEESAHPYLIAAMELGGWIRFVALMPFILTLVYYEKYHQWAAADRWAYSLREQVSPSGLGSTSAFYLGKRPTLVSVRTKWHLLDYVCLPITGFLFLTLPQLQAHISQLVTDKIDYVVAAKPSLDVRLRPVSQVVVDHQDHHLPMETLTAINTSTNTQDGSSPANQEVSYILDDTKSSITVSSRGDSGFFDFDDNHPHHNNLQKGGSLYTASANHLFAASPSSPQFPSPSPTTNISTTQSTKDTVLVPLMTRSGSIGGRRATSPLGGGNNGYTSSDGGLPPLSSKAHQPLTWQPTTIKKDGKVGSLMAGHSDSMSEEDDEDLSRPWTVVV